MDAPPIQYCRTDDGVNIAYAVTGQGPALIHVPGWISHVEKIWQGSLGTAFAALSRHFQVVSFDKRGTGLSDRNCGEYGPEVWVRDLDAVIGALGLETCTLWGYSEGGPVALTYAAQHPARVAALVLHATYANGTRLSKPEMREALFALIEASWGVFNETFMDMFMPHASTEERSAARDYVRSAANRHDAVEIFRQNYTVDVTPLLPDIAQPTLVIHSEQDRAIRFEFARGLAAQIPNARLVPIPGDHVPNAEDALVIADAILDFHGFASVPSASAVRTLLFTDLESSTALTQALGDAKAQEILHGHNDAVRAALAAHDGEEVKHTGDGIFAAFGSAVSAVEAALQIQRDLAAAEVRVRIGLNAGEPIAEEDDYFGTAVQLAARVCDRAEPGQVLVSRVVHDLCAGKGFTFTDQGEATLKGFPEPVRLFVVGEGE